jgi:hypothetical protein
MTEPTDGPKPNDRSEPTTRQESDLEAYIRSNRAGYTEDALRRAAIAAGHPPDAVEAALAATRSAGGDVDRGRIARNIFLAYLATYLILDVLMLINPANNRGSGFLGDVRGIGVVVLSMGLGAAFVASLVWVASRRVFVGLIGIGIALSSLASFASSLGGGSSGFGVVLAIAGVGVGAAMTFAAARFGRTAAPASPTKELLLVVPILLLLAIGGTCVVSGLPIPRPA